MHTGILIKVFRSLLLLIFLSQSVSVEGQCSSVTPTFTLDLTGSPNASSVTPNSSRNGTCCGGSVPCIKIVVLLNPNAMALQLTPQGADPGGALTYEFNCNGVQIPGGTPVCLSGTGPQTLTICKVGNNANTYSVNSIPRPSVQDTLLVRNGCTTTLQATGYSIPTITWTAINAGTNTALFNSYLSCTSGCATVVVTPSGTVPVPYIDYVVSGFGQAPCQAAYYSDTARVFFFNDLAVSIIPKDPTICFGSSTAVLTASVSGGKPPYTYSWTTGSTSQSVAVGVGTFVVHAFDDTGCPPVTDTSIVSSFTLPIAANAGADLLVCKSSPNAALNATITSASGGTWTASSGTFLPSGSALNATYVPSPGAIANGSVQLILGTTGNAGCAPDEDTVFVFFQNQPTITASGDQTVCANNNVSLHSAIISGYSATAAWAAPGGGTLSPPIGLITTFYPTSGQISAGNALIVASTANNGSCPGDSDSITVFFTPSPTVVAGSDHTICSNGSAQLNGTVTPAPFSGSWTTTGDGTFSSVLSQTTSYTPGPNDINSGTATLVLHSTNLGNCFEVTDTVLLTISRIATVTVSSPSLICSSSTNIAVSATVAGAAGTGTWSANGTGNFSSVNSLQPTYLLSINDQAMVSMVFSVTSTANGPCPAVTGTSTMNIAAHATVTAGNNQQICSAPGTINLGAGNPSITGVTSTGSWSASGSGVLVQGTGYQNGTYSVNTTDISSGSVVFTLTSTSNGICPSTSDTVRVSVTTLPQVLAGPNQTICSVAGSVSLSGTVTGGTSQTGNWSTGGGGAFNPGAAFLSTQYSLTPADIATGSISFMLTSTGNGPCPAQQSPVQVAVVKLATVVPGASQAICSTQPTITLTGTVQSSSGTGTWTSAGSGPVSATGNSSASYSLNAGDINTGSVSFTLTSTGNGPCPAVTNTLIVPVVLQPTVLASATPSLCSVNPVATISGTVTGGSSSGNWTSAGTGTFQSASTILTGTYIAGSGDITANGVVLTLSSINHSPCAAATATTFIHIQDPSQAVAGSDQVICGNQATVALTGTVLGTFNTGTWSASGNGAYSPSNAAVTAYSLTPADLNGGAVSFTLTSTNNGACPPAVSSLSVQIIQPATVTVIPTLSVCSTSSFASIGGTVSGGSGQGMWTTTGNGNFQPSNSALSTSYHFTQADVSTGSVVVVLASANITPCPVSDDSLEIFIQIPPQVIAGPPQNICSTQGSIALAGTVINTFNSGFWTTSGTGSILPAGSVAASYFPSAIDIAAGNISFTLTSDNDGACTFTTGTTAIQITRQATVTVSPSQTLCSTSTSAAVTGTLNGGANSVLWTSSGTGGFQPSDASTSTSYIFTAADAASGSVLLTMGSTSNGPCVAATDTVRIYVQSPSTVSTGSYGAICSSPGIIQLTGSVAGGKQSGSWTTATGGTFSPDADDLGGQYVLSSFDAVSGAVSLTLTSTNNGACPPDFSAVTIPVTRQVTVTATPDFSICSNASNIAINATLSGNSAGSAWATSGSGVITVPGNASTSYSLHPDDIDKSPLSFIITAASNGPCPAMADTVKMAITRRPVVTLVTDTSVCASESPIALEGSIAFGSPEVLWVSSGTGSFIPNNFIQNSSYAFSQQDIADGKVHLSLNSVNNGACGNVSSTMTVEIRPSPEALFTVSSHTLTLPSEPLVLTNQSSGASSYTWEISDGTTANTQHLTRSFASVGFYDITLAVENEYMCTDTMRDRIKVISEIKFPTAFTPNGDKLNDTFRPYTDGVTEYEMMIFNRWGEMIFKSENLLHAWDGKFQGKICQQDAYVWKARMLFFDGRVFEGTGSITLLK